MGGSGVVDLFFRKELPLSFRFCLGSLLQSLSRGVNVHRQTSLTQLSEYI
ncbi:unnamed protein product [Brassica oleracea]